LSCFHKANVFASNCCNCHRNYFEI
jgi:hypothetical protein